MIQLLFTAFGIVSCGNLILQQWRPDLYSSEIHIFGMHARLYATLVNVYSHLNRSMRKLVAKAQWVKRRTRSQDVAGSCPCRTIQTFLCGGCDAALCYHYCSNLLLGRIVCVA